MLLQVSVKRLNRRSGVPKSFADKSNVIGFVQQGFRFEGEEVPVNDPALGQWFKDAAGSFYWAGGLIKLPAPIVSNFKDMPINLPSGFRFGIDISHNNDRLDWDAFKNAGCEFCYIKISEGVGTPDQKASANAQNAKQMGFKIGYYHFCHPDTRNGGTINTDAVAEANDALSRMKNLPAPDLPLVLDLEDENTQHGHWDTPLLPGDYLDWIHTFIATVTPQVSNGVMLYSRKEYLDRHLPHNHDLGKHKLWISLYPDSPDVNKVASPIGWENWSVWQYKEKGIIGTSSKIDLNIMKDSSLF